MCTDQCLRISSWTNGCIVLKYFVFFLFFCKVQYNNTVSEENNLYQTLTLGCSDFNQVSILKLKLVNLQCACWMLTFQTHSSKKIRS